MLPGSSNSTWQTLATGLEFGFPVRLEGRAVRPGSGCGCGGPCA